MITKKLMHNVITFCNNYIDNDNIAISVNKYPTFLSIYFAVWTLTENHLDNHIGTVNENIHNEEEFIKFKQKILKELPKLLKQLK